MKAFEITGTINGKVYVQYETGKKSDIIEDNIDFWQHNRIKITGIRELNKQDLTDIISDLV